MPTSPDQAANLAKQLVDIYGDAETTLLRRIAARLAEGDDGPGWEDAKLAQLQDLRRDAERVVDGLDEALPTKPWRPPGRRTTVALRRQAAT